jgi:RHS repeat-associated protein
LNYLNARYYDGNRGRFVSSDPIFWSFDQDKNIYQNFLMDPQSQNSYSYARNNPITRSDPEGKWYKEFIWDNIVTLGNGQSGSSFKQEVGEATNQLTNDSRGWNYVVSNPVKSGLMIGAGSGLLAYGVAAGATALSLEYLGGAGTVCMAFCEKVPKVAGQVVSLSEGGINTVYSTGRTVANNLAEKLTMKEIMSNPTLGRIAKNVIMKDVKWPAIDGWQKMEYVKKIYDGTIINVHYVAQWSNNIIKAVDDFKFK